MKQIVPFNKIIEFKTSIGKIISISLEHTLMLKEEDLVSGDFIINGSYKMTEASQITEDFSYKIPVDIAIDKKYSTKEICIDIDDFTYEIDDNKLILKIDLLLDKLELKEELETLDTIFEEERHEDIDDLFLDLSKESKLEIPEQEDLSIKYQEFLNKMEEKKDEDKTQIKEDTKEDNNVASIFAALKNTEETFSTYRIYIMREGDSIESIMTKYNVDKDSLEEYNNLSDLKTGSKVIIPSKCHE